MAQCRFPLFLNDMMPKKQAEHAIATILATFRDRGHEDYIGEPVSQLEHAVQSAQLAQRGHPNDIEFILATFLHDYGHLCGSPYSDGHLDGYGIRQHEKVGANTLRALGFSEKIARLVEGHVLAKRYLVSTDPAYYAGLSEASKITLEKQGGHMSEAEQKDFGQDPLFDLHIALRRLDEQAKRTDLPTGDLGWLEHLMREHLAHRSLYF